MVRSQPASTASRWRVGVAVMLFALVAGFCTGKEICGSNGDVWFWAPLKGGDVLYFGCVDTDG